jgi:hypothetical protein
VTFAAVVCWAYGHAMPFGVLRADDSVLRASEEAVQAATGTSSDVALRLAEYTLGVALLDRGVEADRPRALDLIGGFLEYVRSFAPFLVPVGELWVGREAARHGDRDAAIAVLRRAVDELYQAGRRFYAVFGIGVLVETLLDRGDDGDLAEAQEAIDRLANLSADESSAVLEITLLRLRALLARARGDAAAYADVRDRYRAMAKSLGYEGHIAWAEAM